MKKQASVFSLLLVISLTTFAQDDLNLKIKDLEKRISLLVEQDSLFRRTINIEDSVDFLQTRNVIINAVDNAPTLVFNFDKIVENIEINALWTRIVDANNPSSDILGSSFTDVVIKAAEKHFIEALDKKDKPRFIDIVNKIVKNPIVSSVLSSNPVTSVVASITNAASDFFTNNITGAKIKNLAVDTKNVFDQKKMEAFNNELAPYIKFYDEMIKANEDYYSGLNRLKKKNKYLIESVSNYNVNLLRSLGIDITSKIPKSTQANNMFIPNKDKYGLYNYIEIINKPNIRASKSHADKYIVYKLQVDDFQDEYNELLANYLKENKRLLQGAKDIVLTKGFDNLIIEELIGQIDNFIQSKTLKVITIESDLYKMKDIEESLHIENPPITRFNVF
jgi:hypothetical protein